MRKPSLRETTLSYVAMVYLALKLSFFYSLGGSSELNQPQPLPWRPMNDKGQVILTELLVSYFRSLRMWGFLKLGWLLPSLPPASFKYMLSYPSSLLTNVSSELHGPSDQQYFSYCPLNFLRQSGLLLILDPMFCELVNGIPYLAVSPDETQKEPPCFSHPLGKGLSMSCSSFHVNLSELPRAAGVVDRAWALGPEKLGFESRLLELSESWFTYF